MLLRALVALILFGGPCLKAQAELLVEGGITRQQALDWFGPATRATVDTLTWSKCRESSFGSKECDYVTAMFFDDEGYLKSKLIQGPPLLASITDPDAPGKTVFMGEAQVRLEVERAHQRKAEREAEAKELRIQIAKIIQEQRERADKAEQAQLAREAKQAKARKAKAQKDWENAVNQCPPMHQASIRKHSVQIGFSKSEAVLAWGRPESINRTTTAAGTNEQWCYSSGSYLYFDNGVLTTIQN